MKFKAISQFQFFFVFNCYWNEKSRRAKSSDFFSWIFLFEIYVMSSNSWIPDIFFRHNHFSAIFSYLNLFIFLKLFVQQQQQNVEQQKKPKQKEVKRWNCCSPFVSINFIVFWEGERERENSLINKCKNEQFRFSGAGLECMAPRQMNEKNVKWRWTKHIKHEIAMFRAVLFTISSFKLVFSPRCTALRSSRHHILNKDNKNEKRERKNRIRNNKVWQKRKRNKNGK